MNPLLEAALRLADLGYPVFPCRPNGKTPLTDHGFKDASTVPAQLEEWWAETPKANIGIPTQWLLVVDIDGASNPWPQDPQQAADLAGAPTSLTPGGGRHHIFRQPDGANWKNSAGKVAPNVDIRANGGYIVVPPSTINGIAYKWAETFELPEPLKLEYPPGWLISALAGPHPTLPVALKPENIIPIGERNDTLARLAGNMRRVGMSTEAIQAALLQENTLRCKPPLSPKEIQKIAVSIGNYEPDQVAVAVIENHWNQDQEEEDDEEEDRGPAPEDPGAIPTRLLRVPGFVSEVMDHCMATAPYPNQVMALCGALALQAVLAGRKVRDVLNTRTNLYLLGLAHAASGKDAPRKLNVEILNRIGMTPAIGGTFASGEGIQDALFLQPCMLFQTDELDGMIQSINKSKDARYETLMGTLMTIYSSAPSIFPLRRKAGRESAGTINQPNLVIFGTAIPESYYGALSERMLTNGFFARMIVFEGGKRGKGQMPAPLPIPPRALETAAWWAGYTPGGGNLQSWNPNPAVIGYSADAERASVNHRIAMDEEYEKAQEKNDAVGTTAWGRVNENTRKLAMLYAISENHKLPEVSTPGIQWAAELLIHQTRRILFMASSHVAKTPHSVLCLKVLAYLREAPSNALPMSALLRKTEVDTKSLQAIITTLIQQKRIVKITQPTKGRPRTLITLKMTTIK
jgi:hypothetical protein